MPTNLDRAEWAAAALRHFQCTTGSDYDDALTDLLCDLHHWCDRENVSFQNALDTARTHYQAECEEENPHEHMAMFRTTVGPAEDIFAAETPAEALALARKAFGEDPGKLGFSPAECGYLELQEIRIINRDAEEVLTWMTDAYRLQLYAPELLKALEKQLEISREIIDAWNKTDKLQGAVQDLIYALESQSECARDVLDSWENGDLAGAVNGLEESLTYAIKAIADAKGGAA
jgi:hypothetical protein